MQKLTIGYSTLAERVGKIVPPPMQKNWGVSIVIQNPEAIAWQGERLAQLMMREDVEVQELGTVGVAKSRNHNIWLAKGEYLVFGDDDVQFNVEGLIRAIKYLDDHPEFSLLLGTANNTEGEIRKRYPTRVQNLTRYNSARAATYEMIIRVDAIRQLGIWFDEEFGAGARNYLGDEYIFIVDMLSAGGKGVFVPINIAVHPNESSGSRWGTSKDRIVRAAIFTRVFGPLAPLVRFGFGLRRISDLGGLRNLLLFTLAR